MSCFVELHARLAHEVERRLEIARRADGAAAPWLGPLMDVFANAEAPGYYRQYVTVHNPRDAIRRYEADLARLEEHSPSLESPFYCAGCVEEEYGIAVLCPLRDCEELSLLMSVYFPHYYSYG